MTGSSKSGTLITFYSYKGGTGRSMALANVACLIAKKGAETSQRVLVVDWDLEAPGLHKFFEMQPKNPENEKRPGIINYFSKLRDLLKEKKGLYEKIENESESSYELTFRSFFSTHLDFFMPLH